MAIIYQQDRQSSGFMITIKRGEFERNEMERKPLLEKEFERYSEKLFKINSI